MDKRQRVVAVLMMTMLDFQESTHGGDNVLMREVISATPVLREKNDDKILRPHWSRGPDNIRIGKTSLYWQWRGAFLCATTSVFPREMSCLDF